MALAFFNTKNLKEINPSRKNEDYIENVNFKVYKFNNRPKPKNIDRIKIISCFSEFGCEVLGCLYCIPKLLKRFPGQYVIAMGWYGREYLYRHLVDEFWEINEEYMWLRDYTRAFHHVSRNLKKIEEAATNYGQVIPSVALGKYAVSNMCKTCGKSWEQWKKKTDCCPSCRSTVVVRSLFTDIDNYKPYAVGIKKPSKDMVDWAKSIIKPKTVGIFARARKTYGRNLQSEFYIKLIDLLESMGYNIIWLGEKQSTLPCPVDRIIDFSRMSESRDLERTLAIIGELSFTVQFWTASTRLAGIMGVPFLLFESPEQIYASASGLMSAQEGKRLELCSFGNKKIVLAHYNNVFEDNDAGIDLVKRAVVEMQGGNWEDIIGLVQDKDFSAIMQSEHYEMLT